MSLLLWSRWMLIAGAAVVLAAGALVFWFRLSLPPYAAEFVTAHVGQAVRIVRDAHAIPHIFARRAEDAHFALGYAHAEDRLWQMDWNRRLARGELAAAVGREALPSDRLSRMLQISKFADSDVESLAPDTKRALDSYARGVNARVARFAALPPEFSLFRIGFTAWKASDSLALLRGMAAQMSHNVRQELTVARAAKLLTPDELLVLYPELGEEASKIRSLLSSTDIPTQIGQNLLGGRSASNAWAIKNSGTNSAPILANDPHLDLGSPSLWYLAHVDAGETAIAGATVPGIPFFVLGQNKQLAWGLTSAAADVQDVFLEKLDPANSSRYVTTDGPAPFEMREEVISIAGERPETLSIRQTRHGPLLSDIGPRATVLKTDSIVVALAYAGFRGGDKTMDALFRINNATSMSDIREALAFWRGPVQNLVVATKRGDIGRFVAGEWPNRKGRSGRAPRVGWTGVDDWTGFSRLDQSVESSDPSYVIEANDKRVPGSIAYVGDPTDEGWRAERIEKLLKASASAGVIGSQSIQMDGLVSEAVELLPVLLNLSQDSASTAAARKLLGDWDLVMNPDRPEPLIYSAWIRELNRMLLKPKLPDLLPDVWDMRPSVVLRILQGSTWCAPSQTCATLATSALEAALSDLKRRYGSDLADWRWGRAHQALLTHPVWSRVPLFKSVGDLRVSLPGGAHSVNRALSDLSKDEAPFAATWGAAYRAVYDCGDPVNSRFMISTGQSGHPASPHFDDLVSRWASGQYVPLFVTEAELLTTTIGTVSIRPE